MTSKITHQNKEYETGKLYETETGWGKLTGFNVEDECFEILNDGLYTYHSTIYELKTESGAITDAPIELEEGCHYLCDFNDGAYQACLYCVGDGLLVFGHNHNYVPDTTKYTPLYKMERAK